MVAFWLISGEMTAANLHWKGDFHFGPFFLVMRDQKLPQKLIQGFLSHDFAFRAIFAVTSA